MYPPHPNSISRIKQDHAQNLLPVFFPWLYIQRRIILGHPVNSIFHIWLSWICLLSYPRQLTMIKVVSYCIYWITITVTVTNIITITPPHSLRYKNKFTCHVISWIWWRNHQSISNTGQWKVKPRWPPMEDNFGRQFQSPTWACTSVLVSHTTFYIFWQVFFGNTHKTCLQNIEISLRILNIFRQSQTELQVIYFHKNKLPNWQNGHEKLLEENIKCTSFFTVSLPSLENLGQFLDHTAITNLFKHSNM